MSTAENIKSLEDVGALSELEADLSQLKLSLPSEGGQDPAQTAAQPAARTEGKEEVKP